METPPHVGSGLWRRGCGTHRYLERVEGVAVGVAWALHVRSFAQKAKLLTAQLLLFRASYLHCVKIFAYIKSASTKQIVSNHPHWLELLWKRHSNQL